MRGLGQLTWSEFKLNLRDPMMVFWSLAFPTLWLVLMVAVIPERIFSFSYEGLNDASFFSPQASVWSSFARLLSVCPRL